MPFQEDVQVPFVVWNAGTPEPPTVGETVSLADLTPSILRLAGVTSSLGIFDGVPVLGADPEPRRVVMEAFTEPSWFAIEERDTVYLRWASGEVQMFATGNKAWVELEWGNLGLQTQRQWRGALGDAAHCDGLDCVSAGWSGREEP